jgi:two-component system, NarL family, nitrate/nitrite response regulator NarL
MFKIYHILTLKHWAFSPDVNLTVILRELPLGYSTKRTASLSATTGSRMRILLADDHDLVRETLAAFLEHEGFEEVRMASTLEEALAVTEASGSFDLVLVDYDMPGMHGLEGLKRMMRVNEGRPVALISGSVTTAIAEEALTLGAAGYVPKTLGSRSMVAAARFMVAGEIYAPLSLMKKETTLADSLLSPREVDVLRGICEGKSNKEIARDHDLQEVTVKLHVKTMSRKLEAKNRTHAAMIARDRKLLG